MEVELHEPMVGAARNAVGPTRLTTDDHAVESIGRQVSRLARTDGTLHRPPLWHIVCQQLLAESRTVAIHSDVIPHSQGVQCRAPQVWRPQPLRDACAAMTRRGASKATGGEL